MVDRRLLGVMLGSFKSTIVLVTLFTLLWACGGGSKSPPPDTNSGEIIVGLTDAQGDFVSYSVDVLSLTFTRANGVVVNALPTSTRIDFAQYVDMTEFITALSVPAGVYTSATLRLSYTGADIRVEDGSGNAVQVQTVKDESGNALTTMDLTVKLEGTNALVIAPGVASHLTLDFDLNATNIVDFGSGSPVLTVQPTLVAEINPSGVKTHRVRGALKSVDTGNASFSIILRPCVQAMLGSSEDFGVLNVTTNSQTIFTINGASFTGTAGITQMNTLSSLTGVIALGDLKSNPMRFEANEVYAGSSIPGGNQDVAAGNVMERTGNILIIKGATLIRQGGSVIFSDQVAVTIDTNTRVCRELSTTALTAGDISVGQRVMVFGTVPANPDPLNLTLDATGTNGQVRLLRTSIRGAVLSKEPLVLNLQTIDGRRVSLFNFTGTGQTQNADPNNYRIDAGTIDLSSLLEGSPVIVRGFMKPFGTSSAEYFSAQTIIDMANSNAGLTVGWFPATANAFSSLTDSSITINLADTGLFHHVSRAGLVFDLTTLSNSPVIKPGHNGTGLFFIREASTWQLFTTFNSLVTGINSRLNNNKKVRFLTARGKYQQNKGEFTAASMTITVE